MFALVLTAVCALLLGVLLTLWVEWRVLVGPSSKPGRKEEEDDTNNPNRMSQPVPLELPKELVAELEKLANRTSSGTTPPDEGQRDETLLAVNLLVQFFFRELRSQGPVRRFLLRRLNQEMEEALTRGPISKIIKGLKIYDAEMGSRAPTIHGIEVSSCTLDDQKELMEAVDFNLDVDYSGSASIAMDVSLAYGKSAFLSVKVARLKGQVRLRFSRQPYSHWSVTFSSPPQLEVDVTSRVQGRSFRHVTALVSSQIHRWIQRKYTLPASRVRHRPFWPIPDHILLPPPAKVTSTIRKGSLEVTVLEVSRLNPSLLGDGMYCTLAIDGCSWITASPSESEGRVVLDVRVILRKRHHLSAGIQFQGQQGSSSESTPVDEVGKDLLVDGVPVMDTEPGSAAEEAGLRTGDIILRVDGLSVQSPEEVLKAIQKTKEPFVIVRIERYVPKRRGSFAAAAVGLTPSMTLENLAEESVKSSGVAAALEDRLLLPLIAGTPEAALRSIIGLDVRRTSTYPLDKVIPLGDAIKFQVNPSQHRFLNLSVWMTGLPPAPEESSGGSSNPASPSKTAVAKSNLSSLFVKKPTATPTSTFQQQPDAVKETRVIGHVNIPLAELAADCELNTQGHHISTYQLYPADLKASLGRQNTLSRQLGFDPRLCYGDIVLSFVYRPDKGRESPSPSPELDSDTQEASGIIPSLASPAPQPPAMPSPPAIVISNDATKKPHDFAITHVHLNSGRMCEFCRKKIWLREALQCRSCGCVCHKKCIKRFPDRIFCNNNSAEAAGMVMMKSDDDQSNPFDGITPEDAGLGEEEELEAAVERLQSREYSESLIGMAKDSGRSLYRHLSSADRLRKISSMLQRLEAATEVETRRRYELAARLERADGAPWTASEKSRMEKEAAVCESRRQALVLLLLFYSSGLRSAEEEEAAAAAENHSLRRRHPLDCDGSADVC